MKATQSSDDAKTLTLFMLIADAVFIALLYVTHIHNF